MNAAGTDGGFPYGIRPATLHFAKRSEPKRKHDFTVPSILGILAVILNLVIPSNLLELIGIGYSDPTGTQFAKLHPGSYAAYLGFTILIFRQGPFKQTLHHLFKDCRGPLVYLVSMVLCIVYALMTTGRGGLSLYLETWIPGGLLAVIFYHASIKARKVCAAIMLALIAVNVIIGLSETVLAAHLVPLYFGADLVNAAAAANKSVGQEYRAYALYDHPLTAAMITMMGVFMAIGLRLPRLVMFGSIPFFVIGLFAFGGRTALATTIAVLIVWGVISAGDKILRKTMRSVDIGAAIASVTLVPAAIAILLTTTKLGERIKAKLYWDESANVRAVQWRILDYFRPHDWLFGIDFDRMEFLCYQIGLQFPFTDIENFWLAMFVSLGIIGYIIFLIGFLSLLAWVWKVSSPTARVILVTVIFVASSSNSLARKSNILTLVIPAALCTTAFGASRQRARSGEIRETPRQTTMRPVPRPLRRPVLG